MLTEGLQTLPRYKNILQEMNSLKTTVSLTMDAKEILGVSTDSPLFRWLMSEKDMISDLMNSLKANTLESSNKKDSVQMTKDKFKFNNIMEIYQNTSRWIENCEQDHLKTSWD